MTAYFLSGLIALMDTKATLPTCGCCLDGEDEETPLRGLLLAEEPAELAEIDEEFSRLSLNRCLGKRIEQS